MASRCSNRNRARGVVPAFLCLSLAACGGEPVDPDLLARVGEKRITADDLRAFESHLLRADEMNAYDKAAFERSLETLVDREVLLLEARRRGLDGDEQVQSGLESSRRRQLAEEMVRREVLNRAEVSEDEVRQAYEKGWNERVDIEEIYVTGADKVAEVRELLESGVDFAEVGRSHSIDFIFGFPAGAARAVSYYPYSNPREVVQALFTLGEGQISAPLPFMRGRTFNRVVAREPVPMEEVEEGIREALWKEKRRLLRGAYLQGLNLELELEFNPAGLEAVLQALRGEEAGEAVVFSFGGQSFGVAEVAELMGPASRRWPALETEAVVAELKNSYLPERLMAADARRQGVDREAPFVAWEGRRLNDLMLRRLQELFVEERVEASEDEIEAYYEENKRRYRIMGRAWVKDLLVEDRALARRLADEARAGADLDSLVALHGIRENVPSSGVIRVFPIQSTIYGKAWMDTVMQAPLGSVRGPVRGKGGYSVLEVTERQEESHYSLELKRVRRSVVQAISERKERLLFNEYLQELKARHADRIEIHPDNLERLRQATSNEQGS